MHRRPLGLFVLLAAAVVCGSCTAATVLQAERIVRAPTRDAPTTVIIKSNDKTMLDPPIEAFIEQVEANVVVYSGIPDDPKVLADAIRSHKPALLFALGTPAARFASDFLPNVPLLFAMVVNYERHDFTKRDNVMGIAFESAPAAEFAKFKMVAPDMRRVVAFYTPDHSKAMVTSAVQDLSALDIELIPVPVASTTDVSRVYSESVRNADGVWMLAAPKVMTPDAFEFLRAQTLRDQLALVTSVSDQFARNGALMCVSPDTIALGAQAAALARKVLFEGVKASGIGVEPPMSSVLTVNTSVAKHIGLEISDFVIPLINETVTSNTN
jgi:ABC-type uncharacterized transport system substrate-binding protein